MNRYLTEFIGTFFLVFVVALTVLNGTQMAPLAIGTVLMVMVYMGGHVSGAHYNPAVTLGLWMSGKTDAREAGIYMVFQVAGGLLAALAAWWLMGDTLKVAPGGHPLSHALLVEVLFTFALVLVVLNTAACEKTEGNSYYGLAIGFTVMAGAFAGGGISGGAFNPAVGVAPMLVDGLANGGALGHVWLYLVGPFAGGALAAVVFKMQHS